MRVWLDRDADVFYFPRESVERLGEIFEDGNFDLLDGSVIADADQIEVDGKLIEVWMVPVGQLGTRPSRSQARTD